MKYFFKAIIYNLKAGEGKLGTDDSEFVRILCSRSFSHLNAIFSAYSRISSKDIEKAIKKEMSGDLEKGFLKLLGLSVYEIKIYVFYFTACLAIVKSAKNKSAYFAECIYDSMAGLGR